MKMQYKPSKPQKVKTSKPAKAPKAPKAPKAEKVMNIGSAKKVKIEKPKKVKEPKIKQPKPEKITAFKPEKVEKAEKLKGVGKFKKGIDPKILVAAVTAFLVVVVAVVLVFALQDNEEVVEPRALAVESAPDKITYYVGEMPVFTGLKLKMILTNGVMINVDYRECDITGFDSSKAEETQVITVKYKDLKTTFTVTIQEKPVSEIPNAKYSGISIKTLPKTQYKAGEWINTAGGVLLVHYEDGTSREMDLIDDYIYGDFSMDVPGTYTVTVKYVERGLYGETTYTITVTE